MRFFRDLISIFKAYDYRDKLLTALGLAVFLLMIVKMIVFPYGLFGFGESGIYTEGLVSKTGIQNINPLFVDYNAADREVSSLVFSGLMKYDPEKGTVVDDIATLAINEEKTEYTFTLRDGVRWHDGEEVDADDVVFTFQTVIQDEGFSNEILKTNFAGIAIEKVDEKVVSFVLEKPNVFFIANLATGLLPEHILSKVDAADILEHDFNKQPVGTGPYMVVTPVEAFADGRTQITLEPNPYYYGVRPEIELMRFIAYPTMNLLLEEINAVNAVPKISGDYVFDFEGNERFELIPYELPQYSAVFMNMESALLKDDERVRLALQKSVDKDSYLDGSLDKIRVDTPLMELNQEDWEFESNNEEAQGALKDAGWSYADEDTDKIGVRYNEDGEALELKFIARLSEEGGEQYTETLSVVDYLRRSWEQVGFSIIVEFLPEQEFKARIMKRDYDLLLVGHSLGYNLDTYSYWHSTQATPLGQNFSNYKSFAADNLIEGVRSTFDENEKQSLLQDLAEKLKEDVPAVFLYRPVYYYATDGKIEGLDMANLAFPSDRFSRISEWKFLN